MLKETHLYCYSSVFIISLLISCHILSTSCHTPSTSCHASFIGCHTPSTSCHASFIGCHTPSTSFHTPFIGCYTPSTSCHTQPSKLWLYRFSTRWWHRGNYHRNISCRGYCGARAPHSQCRGVDDLSKEEKEAEFH